MMVVVAAAALAVLVYAATVSALPMKDLKPEEIYLENLSSERLEKVFESRLERLQSEIAHSYHEQADLHERNLANLHRRRRQAASTASATTAAPAPAPAATRSTHDPLLPELPQSYWHTYSYDTKTGIREKLEINDLTVANDLGDIVITRVFPLNLWNLPAIYQNDAGQGMVIENGRLVPLIVHNEWTEFTKGCSCDISYGNDCACCLPGNCLCRQADGHPGDACVPCGQESSHTVCASASPHNLTLDAATGFEYYLDYYDEVDGLQRVLITSKGTALFFYRIDKDGLKPMHFENGMTTVALASPVTHLGYGETFEDFHGTIRKKRFFVTFGRGDVGHEFHGLGVKSTEIQSGLSQMWYVSGTEMQVWQCGARIMVGVHDDFTLHLYELKANQFLEYQMHLQQNLKMDESIISWRSFTAGFEDYLVVTTSTLARIYLQKGIFYEPVQDLIPPGHGIDHFHAVIPVNIPNCREKVTLITGHSSDVSAYVWNGTAQSFTEDLSTEIPFAVANWNLGFGHVNKTDSSVLFVLPRQGGYVGLAVNALLTELPDPVRIQSENIQTIIEELEEEFNRQALIIDEARDRLANSIEGKSTVSAPINIMNGIDVNGTLATGVLQESSKIFIEIQNEDGTTTRQLYSEHVDTLDDCRTRLEEIHTKLNQINRRLDDAVPAEGSDRTIDGVKHIVGDELTLGTVVCGEAIIGEARDSKGAVYPLVEVLQGIVRYNDTRLITGKKTFVKQVEVGDLQPIAIDGIPVSDLVTTSGPQTIAGAIFSTLVADQIEVTDGGTVDGIDLSEEVVFLDGESILGDCTFLGNVTANDVKVLSNNVDGVDFEHFSKNTLKTSGGTVKGSLEFNNIQVESLEAKEIMGVNIENFLSTTVFKNKPATINGKLTFKSPVKIEAILQVLGNINGRKFPEEYPLTTDRTIDFGKKSFVNVSFDSVTLEDGATVDGLHLNRIVTLDTPQIITGRKTFARGVHIKGNLDITSKIIDGVNLDELNATLSSRERSEEQEDEKFDVVFEKDVYVPSLIFNGTLNGLNISALAEDVIYDDEEFAVISSVKNFKKGLNVTDARFESTFNGVSFKDLVTTDQEYEIGGQKTFENDVTFDTLVVTGLVDGVDIESLANDSLYLDKENQIVTGKKIFTGNITAAGLEVTGKVNGIDFRRVVTKNGSQTFTASQTLHRATFNHVKAYSIQMASGSKVNDIDIVELDNKRMTLNDPHRHAGTITVEGPVSVLGDLNVVSLNGHNLRDLIDNIVTTNDTKATITSDVEFESLVVEGDITTRDKAGANGLNISDIDLNAVRLKADNVMTGDTSWDEIRLQGDVSVEGLVNGVDLRGLAQDAVYLDTEETQTVTGRKIFLSGFHVRGDIDTKTTNGIDLKNRLLSVNTDQVISARYSFEDIQALEDVEIVGHYNEVDIGVLNSARGYKERRIFNGTVMFHGDVTAENLTINGRFNDINVKERMADAIRLNDTDVVITGRKTFTNDPKFNDLSIKILNGRDFDYFLSHVVLQDRPTNLTGLVRVTGSVFAPSVSVNSLFVEGTIDGVDYKDLLNNVIYLDRNQTINSSLIFADLIVNGNIQTVNLNGRKFEEEYLTTTTEQVFDKDVTFTNIKTSDVHVEGLVNSWFLPHEAKNTMKAVGGQVVTGRMTMKDPVEVLNDAEVTGLTGRGSHKMKLADQAIKLTEPAEIEGTVIFSENVNTENLTSSTEVINKVNIKELFDNAWLTDEEVNITGRMVFQGPVTFKKGAVRESDQFSPMARSLHNGTEQLIRDYNDKTNTLKNEYEKLCGPVVSLYKRLEDAIFEPDYFDFAFDVKTTKQRRASLVFRAFNTTYMIVSWLGTCDVTLYIFEPMKSELIEVETREDEGEALDWVFIQDEQQAYLGMAANSENKNCSRQNSVVWRLTSSSYQVLQELSAGRQLSIEKVGGRTKLIVNDGEESQIYFYNQSSQLFEPSRVVRPPMSIDLAISVDVEEEDISVSFRSSGGSGTIVINGVEGEPEHLSTQIDDGVFHQRDGKVFLTLSSTQTALRHLVHHLQLYRVDLQTRRLEWQDAVQIELPAKLTVFSAGNEGSKTTLIVALQEKRFPLVYSVLGEHLKAFAALNIPKVVWAEHVEVPSSTYKGQLDHYHLFGQEDGTIIVTKIVMKGASVPPRDDLTCDTEDLFASDWKPPLFEYYD